MKMMDGRQIITIDDDGLHNIGKGIKATMCYMHPYVIYLQVKESIETKFISRRGLFSHSTV